MSASTDINGWTVTHLASARTSARSAGLELISWCAQTLGLTPEAATRSLAARCAMAWADEPMLSGCVPVFERLGPGAARQLGAALARDSAGTLVGLLSDPLDTTALTRLQHAANGPLVLALSARETLLAWLVQHEEQARSSTVLAAAGDAAEASSETDSGGLSLATIEQSSSSAERMVNAALLDALAAGASDIHLEAQPDGLLARLRIDGALETVAQFRGLALAEQAISRIKILAELDIGERRVPQDGSFRVRSHGRQIDLRVSIMPSVHGEDAVIRVLDKSANLRGATRLSLDVLGFAPHTLERLRRLAALPYGMLLVTGPTGSGKTTTLYAALTESQNPAEKIVTIEDPVEYQLPGVLQIPVNSKKGLDFATGLRSILRHDPDKIMVGEIRDRETAEIAIQSALTGHLVLSTLHANTVFDVFGRFQHMGVDLYSFVSALRGVSAQRLLRCVCPHCAEPASADAQALARLGLHAEDVRGWTLRRGMGCSHCRGSGLRGRRSVAEVLVMTPEIAEAVVERRPRRQIVALARAAGVASLRDEALALAREGHTTLQEVAYAVAD